MKGSEAFKERIKKHLDDKADSCELFAKTYAKENKSLDKCIEYILGEVSRSKVNGWDPDEIYNMAVHYYDEDDIKIGKSSVSRVVSDIHIDLSETEKQEAKQKAVDQVMQEERNRIKNKGKKKSNPVKKDSDKPQTLSLF